MKDKIILELEKYLITFPDEQERVAHLVKYLKNNSDNEISDWNNFNGHITVGAFVYCAKEDKFLVLYHKDLKMYLYPGGHIDSSDLTTLDAAIRELKEETGLSDLESISISDDLLVPFDIDTHLIPRNERLNFPEHYHFDFRYLFLVQSTDNIKFDNEEFKDYKWISSSELENDKNYGSVVKKIYKMISKKQTKRS